MRLLNPFEQKLFVDKRELFARGCPDCAKNMVREAYEAGFELAIKMFYSTDETYESEEGVDSYYRFKE